MKNSADLGGCCPPRAKAKVDNTNLDLQNSSYRRKAELLYFSLKISPCSKGVLPFGSVFLLTQNSTTSLPGFLGEWFDNLQWTALLTSF